MAVTLRGDRGSFGGVLTPAQTAPLRLGALPARAAAAPCLSVGANGDVVAGALVPADIPSVFTRRDVAEPISQTWTWSAPIAFVGPGMAPQPPQPTTRSSGTKLVLYPVVNAPEYALGIDNGALWAGVPASAHHDWYTGTSHRMRLDGDGTLRLLNGTGTLSLSRPGDTLGIVVGPGGLFLESTNGSIQLKTGPTANSVLPAANYKEALGAINRKFLTLHAAELWVETLVAQGTMATIGGRILVAPTTVLVTDMLASGVGPGPNYEQTIQVKHNNIKVGDFLWLEANGQFEVVQALYTPGSGPPYHFIVSRNLDGSGLSDFYAGDAVINTGQTGNGFIDLYSIAGARAATTEGPTIVGNVRTANTAVAWAPRWAIGNLKNLYGNTTPIYGVAFGRPDAGLHVQIDDANGIRFLDAAQSAYSQWDMTGGIRIGYPTSPNIYIAATGHIELRNGGVTTMLLEAGTGNLSLTGNLRSGATAFSTGIGYWLGWNGGTPQMRIGNPTGNRFEWDGTNIRILSGNVTLEPGTGITVLGVPGGAFTPSYGYNLTGRTLGGTSALWGWESSGAPTRQIVLDNTTTNSGTSASIKFAVLGCPSAGGTTYGGAVYLESFVNQYALFKVQCQDVQLGSAGGASLQLNFKAGSNESFNFIPAGGAAGHLMAAGANQDIGNPGIQWRYQWLYGGLGIGIGGVIPSYLCHLGIDSAGKPVSSTWAVTSDARAKRDIQLLDGTDALARVRAVEIVSYVTNGDLGLPAGLDGVGVVAQQAAPFLPRSVRQRDDGVWDWNAHELFMLNIAAVQQLAARVDALERTSRDS